MRSLERRVDELELSAAERREAERREAEWKSWEDLIDLEGLLNSTKPFGDVPVAVAVTPKRARSEDATEEKHDAKAPTKRAKAEDATDEQQDAETRTKRAKAENDLIHVKYDSGQEDEGDSKARVKGNPGGKKNDR